MVMNGRVWSYFRLVFATGECMQVPKLKLKNFVSPCPTPVPKGIEGDKIVAEIINTTFFLGTLGGDTPQDSIGY